MSEQDAEIEVERRVRAIDFAFESAPPRRFTIDSGDDLEVSLEECRMELNALLRRAEAIATTLRHRYQATFLG